MFSLVITIISIALVAALALATLYYGSDAFNQGQAAAQAARLRAQGQQLVGAAELFYAQRNAWPLTVAQMVTEGYLKSIPHAQGALTEALAESPWTMPAQSVPVFVLEGVNVEACRKVNEGTYGLPGVLAELREGYAQQCYGSSTAELRMVATRGTAYTQRAADTGDGTIGPADLTSDPIPDPYAEAGWTVPPFRGTGGAPTGPGGPTDPEGPTEPEPEVPAALSADPAVLAFGSQGTNSTETLVVTIQNTGGTAATFAGAPTVSGHGAFAVAETTCGAALAGGSSCTVAVNYAPAAISAGDAGSLTLSPAETDPVVVSLTGSAFNPVSLGVPNVPEATRKRAYEPFSFASLLQVSNEDTPDLGAVQWQLFGTPPAGLTFSTETGVLSGTPTAVTTGLGPLLSVRATYKNNQAMQSFRMRVGGVYLTLTKVSTGGSHSCGVTIEGGVKCWGNGTSGQLGNGQTTSQLVPVDVVGLTNVAGVSAGGAHTCAVTTGGAAYCWGLGTSGQLGHGSNTSSSTPVAVSNLASGVVGISAGAMHSCVAHSGGTARCWGRGTEGQLGNSASTNRNTPVTVSTLTTVTQVSAGSYFSCAVITGGGGSTRCWGLNTDGTLGNNSTTPTNAPVAATNMTNSAEVSAGNQHTCARNHSGALYCWGLGADGLLGAGNTTTRRVPTLVPGLGSGVSKVSAGYHTCAIVSGQPMCWGPGDDGQIGNAAVTGDRLSPVTVANIGTVLDISAGHGTSCAVASSGQAWCWGSGTSGALGSDATTTQWTPGGVFAD